MTSISRCMLAMAVLVFVCLAASAQQNRIAHPHTLAGGWLFAGFKDNSEDGVYYAVSTDGYHWEMLNDGNPVVKQTEPGELMRDPFLQRAPDGSYRMVWTWSWRTPAVLGYASSDDLLHWTKHRQLEVAANLPHAMNAWGPALYYDAAQKGWLLFWSSTVPPAGKTNAPLDHRIYATHTADFEHFTPAKIFFDPGFNVIDATELAANGKYYLLFKDERTEPLEKHILTAQSSTLEGPWRGLSAPFTETWSEGPAAIPVRGGYLVYYDHYREPQHYGAAFSPDMQHWTDATGSISFPAGLRHGSFLHINGEELEHLRAYHSNGATP